VVKVLIIGDGAREHAIAWALARDGARVSALVKHVNPGLAELARSTGGVVRIGDYLDPAEAVRVAEEVSPDLVVVGPEEPLFRGVPDALRERGFAVFGASRRLAEVERRKDFARGLMWRHRIPGRLAYAVFRDPAEAARYAKAAGAVAIKPIRQAGGKGVRVVQGEPAYLSNAVEGIIEAGVSEAAQSLARQVLAQQSEDLAGQVEYGFRRCLGRPPSGRVKQRLLFKFLGSCFMLNGI